MIYINSKVKSKKPRGEIKGVGMVIALLNVDYFLLQVRYDPDELWRDQYPDWKTKPVALVLFDEPQKTMTVAEWVSHYKGPPLTEEFIRESYEKNSPAIHQTAFPFDDLEEVPQNPL